MTLIQNIGRWLEGAGLRIAALAARWPRWFTTVVVLALLVIFGLGRCSSAHAATGLAIICGDAAAEGKTVADANWSPSCPIAAISYNVPAATQLVRTHATGLDWNNQNETWAKRSSVQRYEVCANDIPAGSTFSETDPARLCTAWAMVNAAGAPVCSGTAQLTWTPGAGPAATTYKIFAGTVNPPIQQLVELPATVSRYDVAGLCPATHYFAAKASNADGDSALSAVGSKVIAAPVPIPQPPGVPGFKVADTAAFDVVKSNDKITLAQIGTVPAGTPCNVAYQVNGFYLVPRAKVVLTGTTRPQVIVAKCGA
ncbi:MAG: hypothetical protein ABI859_14170 [Pseudomonadota bacterium]